LLDHVATGQRQRQRDGDHERTNCTNWALRRVWHDGPWLLVCTGGNLTTKAGKPTAPCPADGAAQWVDRSRFPMGGSTAARANHYNHGLVIALKETL
jgi:hypothetical protein